MSSAGRDNPEQARRLGEGVDRQRVRRWRNRWAASERSLAEAEAQEATEKDLENRVFAVLSDNPRSGAPATFTPEQLTRIIAVACEPPSDSDGPISHWTPAELAREVIKRGIVESISPRHVDRFLKEGGIRPHKSRYWMTSKDKLEDPEGYQANVENICDTYLSAPDLHEQGVHIISTDEKTSIQALERVHPTKPVRPGLQERIEGEYKRHGTLCLIANWDVVQGCIVTPTIGPTRTEEDFTAHIQRTIDTDPGGTWIFVVDQLNTHMSETLVNLVAERCNIDDELGVKGKSGVLKSKKTRKAFLEDSEHRIRFVYTPRHTSWLNQIECWFSILVRRLLKRASFRSLDELEEKLRAFIDYFNAVLAKPFKWTYTGRPLQA